MYGEISIFCSLDNLSDEIVVYSIECSQFYIVLFFSFSFGLFHFFFILEVYLLSDERSNLRQAVHIGKGL